MGNLMIRLYNLYKVSGTNENLNSIVATVEKDGARAVLMADMQLAGGTEDRVIDAIVRNEKTTNTTLYKIGHHGYAGSTGAKTLATLKPKYAVISTRSTKLQPENGANFNAYLDSIGTTTYRTSEASAALVADFSGKTIKIYNRTADNQYGTPIYWKAQQVKGWSTWYADASGKPSKIYVGDDGKPVKGWKQIGSSWYYFDGTYRMATGWTQVGGNWYYMNSSGVMQKGWKQLGGKWYYMNGYGVMQKNCKLTLSGRTYAFNSSGEMCQKGWVQIGKNWFYITSTNKVKTGWLTLSGKKYYFSASGVMQKGVTKIGGKLYYLDSYGVLQTGAGWKQIGGNWYYFKDGTVHTGWLKLGNDMYHFSSTGVMQKGLIKVGKYIYYLDGYGILQRGAGWRQIGGYWYYMRANGSANTGWKQIGADWYYFGTNGVMQKNAWVTTGGKHYYVDGYGIMVSGPGWKQIGGNWYYPDASGAMQTGWLTLGSSTYYLNSAGVMLKNTTVTVGGKTYTLNAYGIRQ